MGHPFACNPGDRHFCQPGHLHTRRVERAGGPHGRNAIQVDAIDESRAVDDVYDVGKLMSDLLQASTLNSRGDFADFFFQEGLPLLCDVPWKWGG
jgi:hypothetical protein